IYLPNGEIINIGYDLTKTEQNEKLLYEQSKLASMGEMIGNIAHQWRQPLSAISTAATGMQLQQEYDCLDPKDLISSCEAINNNAQYLSDTIEDFTNFIKGNKEKTFFHLKAAIQSVVHLLEGTIKQNNITLILNIEDIELNSYENELTQGIINIINNAKDALVDLPNDTKKIIEISTYIEKNYCVIRIKDNAGGIQEDILTKIFDPYFSTKHKSQGTGLGLHMTYKLVVEGLQGTVVAKNVSTIYENKRYKGAEFTLKIPMS
ncbi:MAG: HAMP domain-containing sensor histidine kinase, partial [Arcobacteraceae bacterium]